MIILDNLLIKINQNLLTFDSIKPSTNKNLNNTDIIDTKKLVFSHDYIRDNKELIISFLNTIILKNKINIIRINEINLCPLALELINNNKNINQLFLTQDKALTYNIFLKLLDNDYINYINCYEIPTYLLEKLDLNKNIKIDVRSEVFFLSSFMEENKLYKYSDIFYKKSITINKPFDSQELEEFKTFLNINNYLKENNINNYNNDLIYTIIETFKNYNIKNIKICLYEKQNINIIVNSITYLKQIYKTYLEENNINFKIIYSKEYKRKNIFKQLNFVTLKYTCFVLIIGALIFSGLEYYKNTKAENKLNNINEQITDIVNAYNELLQSENENISEDIEYIDVEENTSAENNPNKKPNTYYTKYNQVFDELSKINDDTIGWLTINNTKINYPIVQADDNEFYLKRDYNKDRNILGWLYMDYRNNIYNMSNNTIIYGHNIKGGLMFGTLRYALNESWYKNEQNQIITFNTLEKNMKWKIFSIYRIPVTNDYLYANFYDNKEFLEFANKLKARSIYDFNIELKEEDKILTLSTCGSNNSQRMVIHAVLINE